MANEEQKYPLGLTKEVYTTLESRIKDFSVQINTLTLNNISIAEIVQLYAQLQLTIMLLNTPGEALPVGFTIPVGGKDFRFQGTVTEAKDSADPKNDG
jgi:hypothetical protein